MLRVCKVVGVVVVVVGGLGLAGLGFGIWIVCKPHSHLNHGQGKLGFFDSPTCEFGQGAYISAHTILPLRWYG